MSLLSDFEMFSSRLGKALNEARQSNSPDALSSVELQSYDLIRLTEELKSLKQDRTERKSYAFKLFRLVMLWLVFILFLIFLQGTGSVPLTSLMFNLSDPVIITLISTTTASIVALLLVVVRYLFPLELRFPARN